MDVNPGAKWDEVFLNVQNHYAHVRSMCGSMVVVEKTRLKKGNLENKSLFRRQHFPLESQR